MTDSFQNPIALHIQMLRNNYVDESIRDVEDVVPFSPRPAPSFYDPSYNRLDNYCTLQPQRDAEPPAEPPLFTIPMSCLAVLWPTSRRIQGIRVCKSLRTGLLEGELTQHSSEGTESTTPDLTTTPADRAPRAHSISSLTWTSTSSGGA